MLNKRKVSQFILWVYRMRFNENINGHINGHSTTGHKLGVTTYWVVTLLVFENTPFSDRVN
jgi:hypothetical protein